MQTKTITRKHRPDVMIILFMSLLMLFSLIMIYQIGPQTANVSNIINGTDYNQNHFFFAQLRNVVMSIVVFFAAYKLPYDLIKKYAFIIFCTGIISCVVLAIASIANLALAQCSLGACRWMNLGFINFQPSEFLKLGLLLYLGVTLGESAKLGKVNSKENLIRVLAMAAASLFFVVVVQKDLGTGVAIACIALVELIISGIAKKILFLTLAASAVLGCIFILMEPHRIDRVKTFLQNDDVSKVQDDGSYHIINAKVAIGSGGLLGVGIGNSLQATGYLPEPTSDSIFAIIGETFGFIGLLLILSLFMILLQRLLSSTYYLHEATSRIVVAGVFGWIASHLFINILAMVGFVPLTGITLPFISSGGTSMIFMAAALGVAYQLSCHTAHTPAADIPQKPTDLFGKNSTPSSHQPYKFQQRSRS